MKNICLLIIVGFFSHGIQAQEMARDTLTLSEEVPDTQVQGAEVRDTIMNRSSIKPWSLAIPAVLIARGALSIDSRFDHKLQRYVTDNVKGKLRIDDHLQYLPIAGVFLLPNIGIEPAHTLKERVLIGATAYAMTAVFVNSIKYTVRQLRPDNSAHNSFPSGHTATVFTGVEMLYQEYKYSAPWVGITGYIVATGVGLLRIYNNRHWASDVTAGAGIGILSAKLSYLLFPYTSKLLQSKKERTAGSVSSLGMMAFPTYDATTRGVGMGVVVSF